MVLPVKSFKGHVIFVWTFGKNSLIKREEVRALPVLSFTTVAEYFENMSGLKQSVSVHFIESPNTENFLDENINILKSLGDFAGLKTELAKLAKDNQVEISFIGLDKSTKSRSRF